MTVDVVNTSREKVGSVELKDEVFGGTPNAALVWASVVHANAADRRGTHATKTRGMVRGSGRKPWRQKGTGRARVGEVRNPLWRKGGTTMGPQPRSYDYRLSRKVELGALRSALADRAQGQALLVVDALAVEEGKTRSAVELLDKLGAGGKILFVDVEPQTQLERAVRNIPGVAVVAAGRLRARDVMAAEQIVATQAAVERLQSALE